MNDNKTTWIYCHGITCPREPQRALKPICGSCGDDCVDLGSDYLEYKTYYTWDGKPLITAIDQVA